MTDADRELLERAEAAAANAYAPYSEFHVGAAVRTRDGRIFEGVNVENAAYPRHLRREDRFGRGRVGGGASRRGRGAGRERLPLRRLPGSTSSESSA